MDKRLKSEQEQKWNKLLKRRGNEEELPTTPRRAPKYPAPPRPPPRRQMQRTPALKYQRHSTFGRSKVFKKMAPTKLVPSTVCTCLFLCISYLI